MYSLTHQHFVTRSNSYKAILWLNSCTYHPVSKFQRYLQGRLKNLLKNNSNSFGTRQIDAERIPEILFSVVTHLTLKSRTGCLRKTFLICSYVVKLDNQRHLKKGEAKTSKLIAVYPCELGLILPSTWNETSADKMYVKKQKLKPWTVKVLVYYILMLHAEVNK